MAQTYNIQLDQGSTFAMTVEYEETDPAGGPNTPFDLTGYSGRMQVRDTVGSATTLAQFTTAPSDGIVINGPAGTVDLTVTSVQTESYTFINAVYDLEVYDASVPPVVVRLVQGRFLVNKEVTR